MKSEHTYSLISKPLFVNSFPNFTENFSIFTTLYRIIDVTFFLKTLTA